MTAPPSMTETIDSIEALIGEALPRLRAMDAASAAQRSEGEHWSPKERVGHLIDAASNFQQQLVRASLDDLLAFPGFEHAAWVDAQHYQDAPWDELVDLWDLLNRHVVRLLKRIPADKYAMPCLIGHAKPVPLEKLCADYAKLMNRQLKHLAGPSNG